MFVAGAQNYLAHFYNLLHCKDFSPLLIFSLSLLLSCALRYFSVALAVFVFTSLRVYGSFSFTGLREWKYRYLVAIVHWSQRDATPPSQHHCAACLRTSWFLSGHNFSCIGPLARFSTQHAIHGDLTAFRFYISIKNSHSAAHILRCSHHNLALVTKSKATILPLGIATWCHNPDII